MATANFPDSTVTYTGFNPSVVAAIQDRTLQRVFRDALYPRLLYRLEAIAELWPVNLGANSTFTRTGLIAPTTRPLSPGVDPTPKQYAIEQWEATAQQWADTIDTHMPTSYVTLASQYLRNMHQLGLHSGQSLNRVVRDKLFNAYVAGNTVVTAGGVASGTSVPVVNLDGFTTKLFNGRPTPVSAANPLTITITGVTGTRNVVGFTPTFAGDQIHSGTLTLDATTGVALTGREAVLAVNRSRIVYSGGGTRVDDVSATDQLTLADIRASVAQLRFDNVPPHEDGSYHCHLDPISESQIFGDNEFQRLNQSIPDYMHYRRFAVGFLLGVTFYRNSEAPTSATVDDNPVTGFTTGFELTNPLLIPIHRPIITGQGAVEEKYLDESRYISDAGVQGKIGEFAVVNGGVSVMTERIRLILRAPMDRLQQQTSAAWSFSGDWPVPTDETSSSGPATFKRAVVIVHGE
jgi:hypothetical protein